MPICAVAHKSVTTNIWYENYYDQAGVAAYHMVHYFKTSRLDGDADGHFTRPDIHFMVLGCRHLKGTRC